MLRCQDSGEGAAAVAEGESGKQGAVVTKALAKRGRAADVEKILGQVVAKNPTFGDGRYGGGAGDR